MYGDFMVIVKPCNIMELTPMTKVPPNGTEATVHIQIGKNPTFLQFMLKILSNGRISIETNPQRSDAKLLGKDIAKRLRYFTTFHNNKCFVKVLCFGVLSLEKITLLTNLLVITLLIV